MNENFFVAEVTTNLEGEKAKALWGKETIDDATIQLHQIMASAMANTNVSSAFVTILNQWGDTVKHEFWQREIPEEG